LPPSTDHDEQEVHEQAHGQRSKALRNHPVLAQGKIDSLLTVSRWRVLATTGQPAQP
jgi:hypothetical protein